MSSTHSSISAAWALICHRSVIEAGVGKQHESMSSPSLLTASIRKTDLEEFGFKAETELR